MEKNSTRRDISYLWILNIKKDIGRFLKQIYGWKGLENDKLVIP